MLSSETVWEILKESNAIKAGHNVLNSGLHSDVKVEADRLIGRDPYYRLVMDDVKARLQALESRFVIPIPNGARELFRYRAWNIGVPYAYTRKGENGRFVIDEQSVKTIRSLGSLTIFEDVVSTGGNSARMARVVRAINPEIFIDLVAIARRGELEPQFAQEFATEQYLTVTLLPAYLPESCPNCPPKSKHTEPELAHAT